MPQSKINFKISDHTCQMINAWCLRVFQDPRVKADYERWCVEDYPALEAKINSTCNT